MFANVKIFSQDHYFNTTWTATNLLAPLTSIFRIFQTNTHKNDVLNVFRWIELQPAWCNFQNQNQF